MATLKLIWVRCIGLAEEASVMLTPLFLDDVVSSPSGATTVTVTGSNKVDFEPDTKVDFLILDGLIYLITPDGAWFASEAIIWNTETNALDGRETSFRLLFDPTDSYANLRPYVFYELNVGIVALFISTIQSISLRIGLFVKGLITLLILRPLRLVLGRNVKRKPDRSPLQ